VRVRVESISKIDPAPAGGRLVALQDVLLEVGDGELVTILGPSGCGKSTLLQVVAGLEASSRGRVTFEEAPARGALTAVFQEHALFPWRTVRDNVTFGLEIRNVPVRQRDLAVHQLLAAPDIIRITSRAARVGGWPSPARSPSSRPCC
jgi:ABC-type nitrate/sulfonate/bicarbonate transport system ATPase subunit